MLYYLLVILCYEKNIDVAITQQLNEALQMYSPKYIKIPTPTSYRAYLFLCNAILILGHHFELNLAFAQQKDRSAGLSAHHDC